MDIQQSPGSRCSLDEAGWTQANSAAPIQISLDAHYCPAVGGGIVCVPDLATRLKLDLQTFRVSLAEARPPAGLSPALQALWWDAKGDWNKAHECAQERDDAAGARVHAYLHRKEGDQANAEYWYRRSRAAPSIGTLDEEWEALAQSLLGRD